MSHWAKRAAAVSLGLMLGLSKAQGKGNPILAQPSGNAAWSSWSLTINDEIPTPTGVAPAATPVFIEPGSGLLSEPFPVSPFEYYRIDFEAEAEGRPLLRVFYTDAAGKNLPDHSTGMDRSGTFKAQTAYTRGRLDSTHARLLLQAEEKPIRLRSAQVHRAGRQEVISWADTISSSLPALPKGLFGRSGFLESFRSRMATAGRLRMVLLGDSIMNDTGNSPLDLLIGRHYPGLDLEVVASVENGRGAWFYRENGRVAGYVSSKKPDLVLIGGISHNNDLEALAAVVDQIQAQSACGILLLSGAVGPTGDPRLWNMPVRGEIPPPTEWAQKVRSLAEKKGVGFFDLEQAWGATVMNGVAPYESYLRDPIHANSRGQIALGRILERLFSGGAPLYEF